MDHDEAVRQKATERYLLDELDSEERDGFEEHLFDCRECALDVRATAMFIEQSKAVLSRTSDQTVVQMPLPVAAKSRGFAWLRPAFVAPAMAILLAVVAYQNLITYPHLRAGLSRPQFLSYASLNIGTRGSIVPVITAPPGQDFMFFLNMPPGRRYPSYAVDLYNAAGAKQWSLAVDPQTSPESSDDAWPIRVPGAHQQPGDYSVTIRGIDASGESTEIGRTQFALQVQN